MEKRVIYASEIDVAYTTENEHCSFPIRIIARNAANKDELVVIGIDKDQADWLKTGLKILVKAEKALCED